MYDKAYGIIETLSPLHVGASAGEETGNLNLIFRDQFIKTAIIPGSSIRGRFRADMRQKEKESPNFDGKFTQTNYWYGKMVGDQKEDHPNQAEETAATPTPENSDQDRKPPETTEAKVKFEYASLVWIPVFCPGQPVVWISCPRLLRRYQKITKIAATIPQPYTASPNLEGREIEGTNLKTLFFNLGLMHLESDPNLSAWMPNISLETDLTEDKLVVVDNNDISMLHDMALYRQSRVRLDDEEKRVKGRGFFNVEALPEGSILIFPIALKEKDWPPLQEELPTELYFGGLESIGFGRCSVTLAKGNQ